VAGISLPISRIINTLAPSSLGRPLFLPPIGLGTDGLGQVFASQSFGQPRVNELPQVRQVLVTEPMLQRFTRPLLAALLFVCIRVLTSPILSFSILLARLLCVP